jgi:hypothetical protein
MLDPAVLKTPIAAVNACAVADRCYRVVTGGAELDTT